MTTRLTPALYRLLSGNPEAETVLAALAAAGATLSPAQENAAVHLVGTLQNAGLWSKLFALYGFLGGAAAPHAINWKSPGTFDLSWNGSLTHSPFGVQSDGLTGFGDTGFIPATDGFSLSSAAFGFHTNTSPALTSTAREEMGIDDGVNARMRLSLGFSNATPLAYFDCWRSDTGRTSVPGLPDRTGLYVGSRTSTTSSRFSRNGTTLETTATSTTGALPTGSIYVLGSNGQPRISQQRFALAFLAQGLTEAETTALHNANTTYQTTLNRL